MKKVLLSMLMALLAFGPVVKAQDTLTVAEGSAMSENLPLSHNFPDGLQHTQMIYPAEMLQGLEGYMITALDFHMMYTTTIYNGSPTIVRLGTTTQTAYAAVDTTQFLPTAGMTVVFNDVLNTEGTMLPINFSEPYLYSGGNLVIDFFYDGQGPMFGAGGHFFGYATGQRSGLMMYNYPEYNESDVYGPFMLPMVDFIYEAASGNVCLAPNNFASANITPHTADLSWTPRSEGQSFILSLNGEVIANELTESTYSLEGLDAETEYMVSLRAVCGEEDTSAEVAILFTTGVACPPATALTADEVTTNSITFHWTADADEQQWVIAIDGVTVETDWTETQYTATDLAHSRKHSIRVMAYCGDEGYSQPAEITVATLCADIAETPHVIDFEDNYLGCWTVENGGWDVATASANALAHGGTHMLRNDIAFHAAGSYVDGPYTIRMPNIVVPNSSEGLRLTWYAAGQNTGLSASNPCTYEVLVTVADLNITDSVMLRDTLTINNDYRQNTLYLSDYAGMTVSVAFRHTTSSVSGVRTYLMLDDLRLQSDLEPEPTIGHYTYRYGSPDACVVVGETATFDAWLATGSDDNLGYEWTSAMATAGHASMAPVAGHLTMVYDMAGRDTITVTATNSYGSASATLYVNIEARTLAQLPFFANFNVTQTYAQEFAQWCNVSLDGTGTSAFSLVTSAHSGIYAVGSYALPDSAQTDAMLVSPAIAVPTNTVNLSILYYVKGSTNGPDATYEVLASNSGRSSYTYFTDTILRDTLSTGNQYLPRAISLTGYAGDTVYLAFRHTSRGAQSVVIDDIEVREAAEPGIVVADHPQVVDAGDTVVYSVIFAEGLNDSVVYHWTSTMLTAGHADTVMLHDSVMAIVYNEGGNDHITVSATNAFGTDSKSFNVTVRNCQPIDEMPWAPYINSANLLCWDMLDIDGDNRTWQANNDGKLYGRYNTNGPDDWAITPALVIPTDMDSVALAYTVDGGHEGNLVMHYEVRLSPTAGKATDDFTEVLVSEDMDSVVERIIHLDQWAGDTIRLAFRHVNTGDDNGIYISNLSIRDVSLPAVHIEGFEEAQAEIPAYYQAIMDYGYNESVVYTWSSAMADSGNATLTANGADLTVVYDIAGNDIITVQVDNGFGTATATYEVVVLPGPCHTPTNLEADSTGTDFISVSWEAGGSESQWEVTFGGTVEVVETTSYMATGLVPDSSYLVVVRAICGTGDTSDVVARIMSTNAEEPGPGPGPGPGPEGIDAADGIGFGLYPNPASEVVFVECNTDAHIDIVDLNGRSVYRSMQTATSHRIDTSVLPQGTYFVKVTTADGTAVGKLLVR